MSPKSEKEQNGALPDSSLNFPHRLMNRQQSLVADGPLVDLVMDVNSQKAARPVTETLPRTGPRFSFALNVGEKGRTALQISRWNDGGYCSNYHAVDDEENIKVIDLCISSIMKFPPWDTLNKRESSEDTFIAQIRYHRTFQAVCEVIRTLMEWHMDPEMLNVILEALKNWLTSPQIYERERATRAIAHVLQIYRSQVPAEKQESVEHVGRWTGRLLPRCVEKQAALRHWGKVAVTCLLNLQLQQKIEITTTELIQILDDEEQCVPAVVISRTAMLVIDHLPSIELAPFLHTTLNGMLQEVNWSEAVQDILGMVLEHRAAELHGRVEILICSMYDILDSSDKMAVKKTVMGVIGALAAVGPNKMVATLLTFPWLVLREISMIWKSLIADQMVFPKVLCALLSNIPKKEGNLPDVVGYIATHRIYWCLRLVVA
ncbi:maestro heat-like repeat-containing protein family member 2A [Hemicordylus capensis]|uniref:maestro heat-like repeat-containing protein family member 2A n=1 Tax=Hemicordylus capensis TaxID=884348 RepID=UPI0023044C1B|nr:maestro heat-like repeat-containing protein family member 2A [Hemicordylus capensis]